MGNVEQLYNKNGEHIRETLTEIARLVLTFYNHIPHTAYFPIVGFEAASSEGSAVRTALSTIDKSIKTITKIPADNVATRVIKQTNLDNIVTSLANLMHYPEITDEGLLGKHRAKTLLDGAKRLSESRDNTKENLVSAIAKHLHITFAVFPELERLFARDEIVKPFISRIISGKEQNKVLWPTFDSQQHVNSITNDVSGKLDLLKAQLPQKGYTVRDAYKDLASSDDEEETTVPRIKVKIEVPEVKADALQELQELRKYKARMDKAIKSGTLKLPFVLQEDLRRECPNLYKETLSLIRKK